MHEVRVVLKNDKMILPDSFLGTVIFKISDLHDGIPRNAWFPVESRPNKKDKVSGEIHIQVMYSERTVCLF